VGAWDRRHSEEEVRQPAKGLHVRPWLSSVDGSHLLSPRGPVENVPELKLPDTDPAVMTKEVMNTDPV
jgi:hypothetical protein